MRRLLNLITHVEESTTLASIPQFKHVPLGVDSKDLDLVIDTDDVLERYNTILGRK